MGAGAGAPIVLRVSRVGRIVSTALITAGLVILVEVVLAVAWAEPLTNFEGWLAQRDAGEQLERLEREFRLPDGTPFEEDAVPRLARRLASESSRGEALGRIKIPEIDLNLVAVEGTDTASLQKGPGHYPRKSLPGQPGTTAFAAHRTTYGAPFRFVNRLGDGDEIVVEMPYATFTYEVERQRIVDPSKTGVVRDVGYPRLVFTSCHPPYSAAERIVIFARLERIDAPPGAERIEAAAPDIAGMGLGPTLVALASMALISLLMWFTGGRRRSRVRGGA